MAQDKWREKIKQNGGKVCFDLVWGAGRSKNCGNPLKQVVTLSHTNISSICFIIWDTSHTQNLVEWGVNLVYHLPSLFKAKTAFTSKWTFAMVFSWWLKQEKKTCGFKLPTP